MALTFRLIVIFTEENKIKFIDGYKNHGIGAAYGAVTKEILNLGTVRRKDNGTSSWKIYKN